MLSRHEIYETSDYSPAQKIVIFLGIAIAVALVVIIGNFIYEFTQTFKTELNHGLFYGLAFLGILFLIVATYSAFYVVAMLTLLFQAKRQQIKAAAVNTALFTATTQQISTGAVYLSEQKTDQGIIRFKHLPKAGKIKSELRQNSVLSLPEPEAATQIKDTLLNDISECQRLLIVGGSGTGKTSLLGKD